MQCDLALLKVLSNRENYDKYLKFVRVDLVEWEIKTLIEDFGKYFEQFPDIVQVDWEEFATLFNHTYRPDLAQSKHVLFRNILKRLSELESPAEETVIKSFQKEAAMSLIHEHVETDLDIEYIQDVCEAYVRNANLVESLEDEDLVVNDLKSILNTSQNTDGLNWRLDCLNNTIGPLNKGKFIIVAAYVDVGKTIFAISESAYMARQLREGHVLWLNNEEEDHRVLRKLWKSVLNCDDAALEEYADLAEATYRERMHGDLERIKFINVRRKSMKGIKALFKKYKPSLVILDQADKIMNSTYKAFSDHDRLKNLYGELRALANEYCPIIAISQADSSTMFKNKDTQEIVYQLYPHHRQLDGSKVGKPGEADAIIMIGRRTDCNTTRGIHVSKNKFGDTIKQEVIFNGKNARYENPYG